MQYDSSNRYVCICQHDGCDKRVILSVQLSTSPLPPLTQDVQLYTFRALARARRAATRARRCQIGPILQPDCWSRQSWFVAGRVATASRCERFASTTATRSTTPCITSSWWEVFCNSRLLFTLDIAEPVQLPGNTVTIRYDMHWTCTQKTAASFLMRALACNCYLKKRRSRRTVSAEWK